MSLRPPAVENRFYPGDSNKLNDTIEDFFSRAGGLPRNMDQQPVKGVVVPHAGYMYSGSTAARSYRAIASGFKNIDTFILIGPSHTGLGEKISLSQMDFETALGIVQNDKELTDNIIRNSSLIKLSEESHILEHSIEVQLPFLQYLANAAGSELSFVPLTMYSHNAVHASQVAQSLHKSAQESGRRIALISSSDFTHAGAAYGFNPCPRKELVDWVYDHDKLALDRIRKLDLDGFVEIKKKFHLTICGSGPIGVLLEYGKLTGAREAKVLQYTTSYDVSRSLRAIVGYASVVVE